MAAKIELLLTIADIESMPEDGNHYELIEGELFVSCAPSLTHQGNSPQAVSGYTELSRAASRW